MSNAPNARRADIYKLTPAELAIRNALIEVEKLPANPMVTNAVTRLASAAKHVADYVDINPTLDISQPARIGIGAIVRLNSGGPNMLVTHPLRDNEWRCDYTGPGGLARDCFGEDMLTLLVPSTDYDKAAEEIARRGGFGPEGTPNFSLPYVARASPFQHGSDEREPADMRMARDTLKRANKVIGEGVGHGIGSAATVQSLLGIATTLKPAEEVLIPYADIEHAFPQWKEPLPEIAPSEQFRAALAKLPGAYDLSFNKIDHWANDPAHDQPQSDGQWRLTRLVVTGSDMEELLREFDNEGHGSRRLVQVMRSVLWHATEGKYPNIHDRVLMRRYDGVR